MTVPNPPAFVQAIIKNYPPDVRRNLLALRKTIYEVAAVTEDCGQITENLKWNEPSYASRPKTGAPIRLAWHQKTPDKFGLYVPCQTSLINIFKNRYPKKFNYDKTRGIIFSRDNYIPSEEVKDFIKMALTYYK